MSSLHGLAKVSCQIHLTHSPGIARAGGLFTVERHHIHPLEFDGPDTAANLIYLCPTSHTAVHELLRLMIKSMNQVPWEIRQHYGVAERRVAEDGYARIVAANKMGVAVRVLSQER